MGKKTSYSKAKLEKFRKNIESKLQTISNEMSDLRENLDSGNKNNILVLKNLSTVYTWLRQELTHTKERRVFN